MACSSVRCALGPEGPAGVQSFPMAHATTIPPRPRRRTRQATRLAVLVLAAVCLLVIGCATPTRVAPTPDRPNVILVLADDLDARLLQQHSADYPNLRKVAAEGTTFQNAFVTDPLCCPSRTTILRGQYAHNQI